MIKNFINIYNLKKSYTQKKSNFCVLDNISFEVKSGDIISLVGPSGVGKSTFLNILGLLDSFDEGHYLFDEIQVDKMTSYQKTTCRNKYIGFIHQFFHLIPELTVLENVALPNIIMNNNTKKAYEYAKYLLNIFNLDDRYNFKPIYLSGGEQQRVAIARALINKPKLLIADEMTGNLDEDTSEKIFDFFLNEINKNNQTLIYATHNIKYAKMANIKYEIKQKNLRKI